MKSGCLRLAIAILLVIVHEVAFAQAEVDPALADYQQAGDLSGNLSSVGSDTLANLVTLWAEEFRRVYPNVNVLIQATGSSTAPPALTTGTSDLGPMSRLMNDREVQAFEDIHGYKPTPIAVAIDALAVFVHKDNPIEGLNISQVDAIFSSTRACGAASGIENWGQLGLQGALEHMDIRLYGRNAVSGTHGYFRQHALCQGDFSQTVSEQPGSASVVHSVSATLNGIGYSGIGYTTSSVRAVPLSRAPGKPFVAATPENAVNGTYPLARFLYVYVNKRPHEPLTPITREFLRMALSSEGQNAVVRDGYVPLPARVATHEEAKLTD